jgi:nitrite reductase (NADH) small subunit/3-phenylpropionate/trans-cinnamate dioxygenase ferredoxin subunit
MPVSPTDGRRAGMTQVVLSTGRAGAAGVMMGGGLSLRFQGVVGERSRMSEFRTVAQVGQIPEGEGRAFNVSGRMIAVFLLGGEYFAINDTCPHMGASLAEGYVEGDAVICPWHAWRFGIRDGLWLDNPKSKLCNETYPVRVEGENIQVQTP